MLSAKCVLEGNGALVDERLVCGVCIRQAERKAKLARHHRRIIGSVAGVSVIAVSISAVFFPAQCLVLTLAAGALLILSGALAFTLSKLSRAVLVFAGVAALAGGAWGLLAIREAATVKHSENVIADKAQHIRDLLKQNCYRQAQLQLESLDRSSRNPAGIYISSEARLAVQQLHGELESWIRGAYGELNDDAHSLLLKLLAKYTESRIRALTYAGSSLQVTFVAETADAALEARHVDLDRTGFNDPLSAQAQTLIGYLSAEAPAAQSIEVKLVSADGAELKTVTAEGLGRSGTPGS